MLFSCQEYAICMENKVRLNEPYDHEDQPKMDFYNGPQREQREKSLPEQYENEQYRFHNWFKYKFQPSKAYSILTKIMEAGAIIALAHYLFSTALNDFLNNSNIPWTECTYPYFMQWPECISPYIDCFGTMYLSSHESFKCCFNETGDLFFTPQ